MLNTALDQDSGLEPVLTGSAGRCAEHEAADEATDNTDDSGDGDGAC